MSLHHCNYVICSYSLYLNSLTDEPVCRACLDQLLIAIRSFTLPCDHSRSENKTDCNHESIAKLGIIYATACHASLCTATLHGLSVSCHCHHTALTSIIQTRHGEGEVGITDTAAAAAGALGLSKVSACCH